MTHLVGVDIPPQPTLPPEVALTDAEHNFMVESPPKFFPDNQDSNWGLFRKIFTDQIQVCINQLNTIWAERFPMSSTLFLDEWEKLVSLPINPTGKTTGERRNAILIRLQGGPWDRELRRSIVEGYLSVLAFGDPIQLLPPGVPLVSGGVPLYDEPGIVRDMYRIYEDVQRFRYEVVIDSDFTPDVLAMQRDLQHFQYGGLTLVMRTSRNTPLDYEWDTYATDPQGFWRLDETGGTTALDSSPHGLTGAYNGTYTLNAVALIANDGTRKEVTLNTGYISVPDSSYLDIGDTFSADMWIKRVTVDANNQYLISKGTGAYAVYLRGSDKRVVLSKVGTGDICASTTAISDTNTHYIAVRKSGTSVGIWIDGVNVTGAITNQTLTDNAVALNIGREVSGGNLPYLGTIGYVAIFNRYLSDWEIQRRYNTGIDNLNFYPALQ